MRIILLLLCCVLTSQAQVSRTSAFRGVVASQSGLATYTNSFDSYNTGNLTTNSGWTAIDGKTMFITNSGSAGVFYGGGGGVQYAAYTNVTFAQNQACQFTLSANSPTTYDVGLIIRWVIGTTKLYRLGYNKADSTLELIYYDAHSPTLLASFSKSYSIGDKLWLEAAGNDTATRLTVKEDTGSGWVTVTNSLDPGVGYYISGPGFLGISGYNSTNTATGDNFYATDL